MKVNYTKEIPTQLWQAQVVLINQTFAEENR